MPGVMSGRAELTQSWDYVSSVEGSIYATDLRSRYAAKFLGCPYRLNWTLEEVGTVL